MIFEKARCLNVSRLACLVILSMPLTLQAAESTNHKGVGNRDADLVPQLARPFSDHAVLQQGIRLPVWGNSLPGAMVSVSYDGQTKTGMADAQGRWRVLLDPLEAVALKSVTDSPAGKNMTVTCEKDGMRASVEIRDLLVGEVWLCAGQSNMAGKVRRAGHPKNFPPNSVNKAAYPALRYLAQDRDPWLVCSPETVVEFSRVAFFFTRRVQREVLVPMGVMITAVGGSNIEGWLNQPPYPTGGNYETLLKPLVGYGIRGAIWYQGESNEKDGRGYAPKLQSLITGWRKAWGQGDFPVHFVQLPGLRESTTTHPAGGDGRAEIRQAYVDTLALKNTGMVVTIDVGTPGEHPPNKYDTGVRLARSVLNQVYGIEGIRGCPLYKSHRIEGSAIRVSFNEDAKQGLMIARKGDTLPDGFLPAVAQPGAKLDWLSIQDSSGKWHWAAGVIDGSELVVTADGVKSPKAVRYAYTSQPLGNLLYNTDGMPVGPFSTCGDDD